VIIAVDGPAAAGKGTIARALAQHFGYHFLDTGTLYRRVGLVVLKSAGDATEIARSLNDSPYDDVELRTEEVGAMASVVASIPAVRQALLAYQREFAGRAPGAVLDGRDIGTVVCPAAQVKIYVTASPEVRAKRRCEELKSLGMDASFSTTLDEIRIRDERDSNRALAPLLPAPDATIIDTSDMTIEAAVAAAVRVVELAA
jgi:cytidylate kinase